MAEKSSAFLRFAAILPHRLIHLASSPGEGVAKGMKKETTVPFIIAFISSAAIWVLSPLMTGRQEPWDAEGFYYVAALIVAGLVSGATAPKHLKVHYFGSILGQTLYELLFIPIGGLFPLGLIFLAVYSVLFLGGAYLGSQGRLYVQKRMSSAQPR